MRLMVFLAGIFVDIRDDDSCALVNEPFGSCLPDSRSCARHYGHPVAVPFIAYV